jgi:hypothetical protein
MARVAEKAWSKRHKVLGNLLPSLVCLPLLVVGLILFKPEDPLSGPAIWFFVAFPIVGWVALNFLGLHQNAFLRRELTRRLGFAGSSPGPERYFVGIARPKFRSILDPHEDLGFLIVHGDRLEFVGETVRVELPKDDIIQVRFRPNPHSIVLLGRWISVEGLVKGTPVRLLVEPREKNTLMGNLFAGEALRQRLASWLASDSSDDSRA